MPIIIAKPFISLTDDFESYSTGAFFPNANWTEENSNADWTIEAADSNFSSQYLRADMLVEGESYLTHNATGVVSDGTIKVDQIWQSSGSGNNQAGIVCRFTDSNNLITVRLNNFPNPDVVNIVEISGGSLASDTSSSGVVWATGTNYYTTVIMSGTTITANVYTDKARTSLFATVTATGIGLASGKIGVSGIGNGFYNFDDFDYS